MEILIFILAAVCAYLICGINPAIILSKLIYHQDIRTCGSGNPGFTNFKRTYGNKWAWWVLVLDLGKAIAVTLVFGGLFKKYLGNYTLGAAYTGLFAMLGHTYPLWYGFKGGKGFLVCMALMWVIDWRVGLAALGIMMLLLLTTKYMSLANICAMLSCPITWLAVHTEPLVIVLCTVCVMLMTWRHRENIKRLIHGTESKFSFKNKTVRE